MKGLCNLSGGSKEKEMKVVTAQGWKANTTSSTIDCGKVEKRQFSFSGRAVAGGSSYARVQISNDNSNWTSPYSGASATSVVGEATFRYIRVAVNAGSDYAYAVASVCVDKPIGGIVNLLKRLFTRNEVIA